MYTNIWQTLWILSDMKLYFSVRHIGFQNGRNKKNTIVNISGSYTAIDLILVSKCMFWRSRKTMVTVSNDSISAILDFKMAATLKIELPIFLDLAQLLTWFWYPNVCFWGQRRQWFQFPMIQYPPCWISRWPPREMWYLHVILWIIWLPHHYSVYCLVLVI